MKDTKNNKNSSPQVIGYEYHDGGFENETWNGRPRWWVTERLSRGGNESWNGETYLMTQADITDLVEAGFTFEPHPRDQAADDRSPSI
jgi:hypothetical protein